MPIDLVFYKRSTRAANIKAMDTLTPEEQRAYRHRGMEGIMGGPPQDINERLEIDKSRMPYTTICDTYMEKVITGKIHVVARAVSIEGRRIFCEKGDVVDDIDAVVCGTEYLANLLNHGATGFEVYMPYFSKDIKETIGFNPSDKLQPFLLYEAILHPKLENVGFVGMYRGPYFAGERFVAISTKS